jgi:hypothetical protein
MSAEERGLALANALLTFAPTPPPVPVVMKTLGSTA